MNIPHRIAQLEENQEHLKAAIKYLAENGHHEYHRKSVEELEKMKNPASRDDPNADLSCHLQSLMLTIAVIISEMAASPLDISLVELVESQNLYGPLRLESVDMDCLDRILTEIESMPI